jgi:hypothetical protein
LLKEKHFVISNHVTFRKHIFPYHKPANHTKSSGSESHRLLPPVDQHSPPPCSSSIKFGDIHKIVGLQVAPNQSGFLVLLHDSTEIVVPTATLHQHLKDAAAETVLANSSPGVAMHADQLRNKAETLSVLAHATSSPQDGTDTLTWKQVMIRPDVAQLSRLLKMNIKASSIAKSMQKLYNRNLFFVGRYVPRRVS